MPHQTFRWLSAGDGAVWFAWLHGYHLYTGRWETAGINRSTVQHRDLYDPLQLLAESEEELREEAQEHARMMPRMWDAAVDFTGTPWLVWSAPTENDTRTIFSQRCVEGEWGPPLQVSQPGMCGFPAVTPDEYGNVWIVWQAYGKVGDTSTGSLVLCRMGPRSGQETPVAKGSLTGPLDVTTRNGIIRVAYMDPEGQLWAVEGTEHQGFGPPCRITF